MNFIQAFEDWVASSKTKDFEFKISGADFEEEINKPDFGCFELIFENKSKAYGWFDYKDIYFEFDHNHYTNKLEIRLGD